MSEPNLASNFDRLASTQELLFYRLGPPAFFSVFLTHDKLLSPIEDFAAAFGFLV
jgi:hypothetical protein